MSSPRRPGYKQRLQRTSIYRSDLDLVVLPTGTDLLVAAGATRISIGYEPDNPASGHLYSSAGFEPHRQTDVLGSPTHGTQA
jgi:hypothetical protein